MNKEQINGSWNEFAGKVRQEWNKLTDDDIGLLKGKRQEFFGKLEKQHGIAKEKAEKRIEEFEKATKYTYNKDQAA